MKIVIAPDSYKDCLSTLEVSKSIQRGIERIDAGITTKLIPMADGGEGTVRSLIDGSNGKIVECFVHDPLFRKIKSFYGIMGDGNTAVIEMSAASGLPLLKLEERNPLKATTFGTGELIKHAMDNGCIEIIIGLGGSATNDGGCGMAQALGARFLDVFGNELRLGGSELSKIHSIDTTKVDERIRKVKFIAACDVDNPLCGKEGATAVYGWQKGAIEKDILDLEKGLSHFASILKQQFGKDIKDIKGAGAAGGLGAGLIVFLNASLKRGIDIVISASRFIEKIEDADLLITGEGRIDFQTASGKAPYGIAQIALQKGIPVIAIAGSLGNGYQSLYSKGFNGIFSIITRPMTLEEATLNAGELIENAAESCTRLWLTRKISRLNKVSIGTN